MSDTDSIESIEVDEPCWMCGAVRRVTKFIKWPRLNTGTRPEAEHTAAQTPADWDEGSHGSDNIGGKA